MPEPGIRNDNVIAHYRVRATLAVPRSIALSVYPVNKDERLAFSYHELDSLVTRISGWIQPRLMIGNTHTSIKI